MHIERSSNKSYPVLELPPPAPPYTGGELITKRFLPLCKGELVGVVPLNPTVNYFYNCFCIASHFFVFKT